MQPNIRVFDNVTRAMEEHGFASWELYLYSDEEVSSRIQRPQYEIAMFRKEMEMEQEIPEMKPVQRAKQPISCGVPPVDTLLGGGLLNGTVASVFGQAGVGKTCFLVQAMLANPHSVCIVTENNIQLIRKRMEDILTANHDDFEVLDTLMFVKIGDATALRVYLNVLARKVAAKIIDPPPPLIVIDSITPLFPQEATGNEKEQRLLLADLDFRRIATELDCAILLSNQVRDSRRYPANAVYTYERQVELAEGDAAPGGEFRQRPAYGFLLADYVDTRMTIIRDNSNLRKFEIVSSSFAAPGSVKLAMTAAGLTAPE